MNSTNEKPTKKKEGSRSSRASPAGMATPMGQPMDCGNKKEATPGTSGGSARREAMTVVSTPSCIISDADTDSSASIAVAAKKRPRSSGESDQRRAFLKGRRVQSPGEDLSPARRSRRMPTEEELADDMRPQPTANLGAKILAQMDVVRRVAVRSANLKGTYIRDLKEAALTVRAATTEMAKRSARTNAQQVEEENLQLRNQVADLKLALVAAKAVPVRPREKGGKGEKGDWVKARTSHSSSSTGRAAPISEERLEALFDTLMARVEKKLVALRKELSEGRTRTAPTQQAMRDETLGEVRIREVRAEVVACRRGKSPIPAATRHPMTPSPLPGPGLPPPPPPTQKGAGTWATVAGRKGKKAEATTRAQGRPAPSPAPPAAGKRLPAKPQEEKRPQQQHQHQRKKDGGKGAKAAPKTPQRRPPRTAAIALTIKEGAKMSYAEAMSCASKINLAELNITELRPKRAVTGGLLLEIPGPEGAAKADALAARMREVLGGEDGVSVARPTKMAEMRVRDLVAATTTSDVAAAIAVAGGCAPAEVKTGEIRSSPLGLGTVWVKCPLAAARKVVAAKKIRVGWTTARVEALADRPLQCFRCLETGHVRQRCTNTVDRSGRCHNCGSPEHRVAECRSAPRCPLCADLGKPSGHRMGTRGCVPPKGRRNQGAKGAQQTQLAPKLAALSLDGQKKVAAAPAPGGPGPMAMKEGEEEGEALPATPPATLETRPVEERAMDLEQ